MTPITFLQRRISTRLNSNVPGILGEANSLSSSASKIQGNYIWNATSTKVRSARSYLPSRGRYKKTSFASSSDDGPTVHRVPFFSASPPPRRPPPPSHNYSSLFSLSQNPIAYRTISVETRETYTASKGLFGIYSLRHKSHRSRRADQSERSSSGRIKKGIFTAYFPRTLELSGIFASYAYRKKEAMAAAARYEKNKYDDLSLVSSTEQEIEKDSSEQRLVDGSIVPRKRYRPM